MSASLVNMRAGADPWHELLQASIAGRVPAVAVACGQVVGRGSRALAEQLGVLTCVEGPESS